MLDKPVNRDGDTVVGAEVVGQIGTGAVADLRYVGTFDSGVYGGRRFAAVAGATTSATRRRGSPRRPALPRITAIVLCLHVERFLSKKHVPQAEPGPTYSGGKSAAR